MADVHPPEVADGVDERRDGKDLSTWAIRGDSGHSSGGQPAFAAWTVFEQRRGLALNNGGFEGF